MRVQHPRLDIRLLAAFALLARKRHFGRTAAALHLSTSALSQQMRRLERDLSLTLFDRNSRQVELTPAAERILGAVDELLAAERRTLRAIAAVRRDGSHVLRMGYLAGCNNLIPAVTDIVARLDPDLVLESRRLDWADQVEAVRTGVVDASFVRPPLDFTDLATLPLWTEPRVIMLAATHALAAAASLSLDDIADEPIVKSTSAPSRWGRWWTVDPRPDGRRPRYGPDVHTVDDVLDVVGQGRCCCIIAASVARMYPRPGVVYIPLTGVEPSTVVLCWAGDDHRPTTATLLAALRSLRRDEDAMRDAVNLGREAVLHGHGES